MRGERVGIFLSEKIDHKMKILSLFSEIFPVFGVITLLPGPPPPTLYKVLNWNFMSSDYGLRSNFNLSPPLPIPTFFLAWSCYLKKQIVCGSSSKHKIGYPIIFFWENPLDNDSFNAINKWISCKKYYFRNSQSIFFQVQWDQNTGHLNNRNIWITETFV